MAKGRWGRRPGRKGKRENCGWDANNNKSIKKDVHRHKKINEIINQTYLTDIYRVLYSNSEELYILLRSPGTFFQN